MLSTKGSGCRQTLLYSLSQLSVDVSVTLADCWYTKGGGGFPPRSGPVGSAFAQTACRRVTRRTQRQHNMGKYTVGENPMDKLV